MVSRQLLLLLCLLLLKLVYVRLLLVPLHFQCELWPL
jgi:hypothetical protein